jgi:hypothetical protein
MLALSMSSHHGGDIPHVWHDYRHLHHGGDHAPHESPGDAAWGTGSYILYSFARRPLHHHGRTPVRHAVHPGPISNIGVAPDRPVVFRPMFAKAIIHAAIAWLLCAPLVFAVFYGVLSFIFKLAHNRIQRNTVC